MGTLGDPWDGLQQLHSQVTQGVEDWGDTEVFGRPGGTQGERLMGHGELRGKKGGKWESWDGCEAGCRGVLVPDKGVQGVSPRTGMEARKRGLQALEKVG